MTTHAQLPQAHAEFRSVMREAGLKVLTVREILAFGVDTHVRARVALENLAMAALTYELHPDVERASLSKEDQEYLSDNYKRQVREY